MIVLDTNVVSEFMRTIPDERILRWLDRYPPSELFVTAVTVGELGYGIVRLPAGKRKSELSGKLAALLSDVFGDQILPYDGVAAVHYSDIVAGRERAGRPIETADAQIAAICRCYPACLATRNVKDFVDTGLMVLNPWDGTSQAT